MPWFTLEGPKLYRRGDEYFVFAPAGSVKGGWQGVFRSTSILGPYEGRSVMDQGATAFNGPHQGAWIDPPGGAQDWFLHFQDTDTYGRRVLLEPMHWGEDGWPLIGERQEGTDFGQPVVRHKKPDLPVQPIQVPVSDDDFSSGFHLGWQWSANPADDWVETSVRNQLRLKAVASSSNLWEAGNILTQKLPAMAFCATTKLSLAPKAEGERAGLVVLGADYGWIGLESSADGIKLVQATRLGARDGAAETVVSAPLDGEGAVMLRACVEPVCVRQPPPSFPNSWPSMLRSTMARVAFSYRLSGEDFVPFGKSFLCPPGRWVGAQVGILC